MRQKTSILKSAVVAFCVLTVGGMAFFFNLYTPWQAAGPNQIDDGSFETATGTNSWTGWSDLTTLEPEGGYRKSAGLVLGTEPNRHSTLKLKIKDTETFPAFQLSMRATATGVREGKLFWHHPRAIFFFRTATGKSRFDISHCLFSLGKDAKWRTYKKTFPVPKDAETGWLYLQNLGKAGTLQVDDIAVIPAVMRPSALFFSILFVTLIGIALALSLAILKPWTRPAGIAVLLTALAILAGVTAPGELLDSGIETSFETVTDLTQRLEAPKLTSTPKIPVAAAVQKTAPALKKTAAPARPARNHTARVDPIGWAHRAGHFCLFMLLAVLSMVCWAPARASWRRGITVLACLFLFAAATETLQFAIPGRTARLTDLFVDLRGILIAACISFFLTHIKRLFCNRLSKQAVFQDAE